MTVLLVERYIVEAHGLEAFRDRALALAAHIRDEPGALWASALVALDEADVVSIVSEWRTDQHCDAFTSGPVYEAFRDEADGTVREDPSSRRFSSAPP